MKKYSYRKLLIILFMLNLFAITVFYIKYCKSQLPNTIHIKKGEKISLCYNIPASATINNQKIKLNRTFIFQKCSSGQYEMKTSLFGAIPLKKIKVKVVDGQKVIPSGQVVGIYVETNGLLVIDTDGFTGENGVDHAPSKNKLYRGDYIKKIDGADVLSKKQFIEKINQSNGNSVTLTVSRRSKVLKIKIKPEFSKTDHMYKIGAWIRDNTQGIGTMTYIKKDSFGGLGHGIYDMDTGKLLKIKGGFLLTPQIYSIKKGKSGTPGEIVGSIEYKEENIIGSIKKNTEKGIYGTVSDTESKAYEIGYRQDVKKGKAYILSNLTGSMKKYEIRISKVVPSDTDVLKSMEIEVTDKRLLNLTNGIIQGMSGSPIIQDGKLIGAVTHVFVDDPTKGYAILMETMIYEMKK
ncbi:MAG: SpoIVB peptidase [Anaerostipes sp.]|jgi:stage IV sporulation protein B|uniref:SpoIVB peptidase n=1 Tax=Anaerostipes TaxID=207244 RepID=UPI00033A2A15|nr:MULTISPECIES: SpoIVB peptidase [Anaerostipes]MBR9961366.1 SpoIVB peptidase [Anaerostipes sp. Marseille-Q3525]MBT9903958.1 SpoIVB peptidase [Anaerostipes hadrus]MCO7163346.1 SpoIVB peptidase [Anaerostipes hadrus]CDD71745.1 stage IV sporulation protein B [Firmicutes bacterium CAG:270]